MSTIRYRRDLHLLFSDTLQIRTAEIGVAQGLFSEDIIKWGGQYHYCVDTWECNPSQRGDGGSPQSWHDENYRQVIERMKPYDGRYEILRGPSTKMAQMIPSDSLDFINVDADHSYEGVKNDIESYWPKLKRGGIICFHDFEARQYGVKDAVMEFAKANNLQVNLLPEDKQEDAGCYIVKP
jgi:hypothetical protein